MLQFSRFDLTTPGQCETCQACYQFTGHQAPRCKCDVTPVAPVLLSSLNHATRYEWAVHEYFMRVKENHVAVLEAELKHDSIKLRDFLIQPVICCQQDRVKYESSIRILTAALSKAPGHQVGQNMSTLVIP